MSTIATTHTKTTRTITAKGGQPHDLNNQSQLD